METGEFSPFGIVKKLHKHEINKAIESLSDEHRQQIDSFKKKRKTPHPSSPGKLMRSPGTEPSLEEKIGNMIYTNYEPSPDPRDNPRTKQPAKKATPVPDGAMTTKPQDTKDELVELTPERQQFIEEAMKKGEQERLADLPPAAAEAPYELMVDESRFVPGQENASASGFVKGGLTGMASDLLSTLARSAVPTGFQPVVDQIHSYIRMTNPETNSERLGREFTSTFSNYVKGKLFDAGDMQNNRLAVQDSTHNVSPFVLDLIYNVQPRQPNQVGLLQLNYLAEQKALLPFPV